MPKIIAETRTGICHSSSRLGSFADVQKQEAARFEAEYRRRVFRWAAGGPGCQAGVGAPVAAGILARGSSSHQRMPGGPPALAYTGAGAASWPRAGGVSSLAKGGDYGQGTRDAVYAFR